MTQRQFVIGLIEDELQREQDELEAQSEAVSDENTGMEEEPDEDAQTAVSDGFEPASAADEEALDPNEVDADFDADFDASEDEDQGFGMTM